MLLQIFGPREQVQRLQAAPGNAYHFAKLAHYAAAVTEQGLEDEAYFAPLADMEALPPALTLTHPLTRTLPLTLSLTLNPNPNPHPIPIPHQAVQRQLHLPYISTISPLYLHYISTISPLTRPSSASCTPTSA